ncbi:MAG: hypothetical protein V3W01_02730 [Dehalococcoidales bacterium]
MTFRTRVIAGTVALGLVLVLILMLLPDGETTPPATTTSGSGTAEVGVFYNPGNHPFLMPVQFILYWTIVDSTIISFTGIPGVEAGMGELTGPYVSSAGTFFVVGEGTYAGYEMTQFIFEGYISLEGIFGELYIGNGGDYGGVTIVYSITLSFM